MSLKLVRSIMCMPSQRLRFNAWLEAMHTMNLISHETVCAGPQWPGIRETMAAMASQSGNLKPCHLTIEMSLKLVRFIMCMPSQRLRFNAWLEAMHTMNLISHETVCAGPQWPGTRETMAAMASQSGRSPVTPARHWCVSST